MTDQLDVSTEAIDLVNSLCLEPHPEGGWFRRTWTAPAVVETEGGRRPRHGSPLARRPLR